ncbi:MAG: SpoIIE family protein phosphatase [Gemmatimonas sp.]|nr:SpoIIE family protein phosphatase [Gemmatimonas sp.]
MTIAWEAVGRTDTGRTRRGNEDAFRIAVEKGVFLVADGMGGHAAGEVASQLAADAAIESLSRSDLSGPADIEEGLRTGFREAYRSIVDHSRENAAVTGMGTTLTIAVVSPSGSLHVGHLGDSRIYQLSGDTLKQLTHDHTWVQQEVDAGRIAAEAARTHPLSHILTKVLTADEPPKPDIEVGSVKPRDCLLLCSDGLYNMVDAQVLLDLLRQDRSVSETTQILVEEANRSGGADNITVVVVGIRA